MGDSERDYVTADTHKKSVRKTSSGRHTEKLRSSNASRSKSFNREFESVRKPSSSITQRNGSIGSKRTDEGLQREFMDRKDCSTKQYSSKGDSSRREPSKRRVRKSRDVTKSEPLTRTHPDKTLTPASGTVKIFLSDSNGG